MKTILHTSDFHINIDEEKSKSRLSKLAETLKNSNVKIDFLIFSGDVIDAKTVVTKCERRMAEKHSEFFPEQFEYESFIDWMKKDVKVNYLVEEYNKMLEEETSNAYGQAAEIFSSFIEQLGISDMERVIICCGNHDRLRLISLEKDKFVCDNEKIDEKNWKMTLGILISFARK